MVLRCGPSLLTCGTGGWDTSNAKALMFFRNKRAMASSTTGTYRHVMSAPSVSEQQALLKQATYDVRAFKLVTVDTMGPISPQALGGYNFVTKFVGQHTKWKEIFLIT